MKAWEPLQYVYSGLSLLKYSSRENRDFSPLFIHSRRDGRLDWGIGGDILPTLALQSSNEPDGLTFSALFDAHGRHIWGNTWSCYHYIMWFSQCKHPWESAVETLTWWVSRNWPQNLCTGKFPTRWVKNCDVHFFPQNALKGILQCTIVCVTSPVLHFVDTSAFYVEHSRCTVLCRYKSRY